MSALVLTILICVVWLGLTALGYLRGGWREVVTLAAILLAYAVASEWAGPNGRDLAGLFGGNTFRSSATIGLAYLFVGTLLFGYFGGSRLPRPIPLSATERFLGGAIGFCNGGLLLAMTLRILHAYAFAPGDGRVLTDATLSRWLITDVGYLLLVALLVAVVAPFVSFLLVRQPQYTARYTEEPALQPSPTLPWYPEPAAAAPVQPEYEPTGGAHAALRTEVYPAAIAIPMNDETRFPAPPVAARVGAANGAALLPLAPSLPPVVSVPTWPTPGLPAVAAQGTKNGDAPIPATRAAGASSSASPIQTGAPGGTQPPASARPAGPPGTNITASQPLPTVGPDTPPATEAPIAAPEPSPPAGDPASSISAMPIDLPASTIGPAPFTARHVPAAAGSPPAEAIAAEGGQMHPVPASPAAAHDTAPQPGPQRAPSAMNTVASPPAPAAPRPLLPTAPTVPQKAEMPAISADAPLATPAVTDATTTPAPARVARARVATARADVAVAAPGDPASATPVAEEQRPVQPGPNMHPCPVCDYPVRNGARFCPNCGSAQLRG